MRIGQPDRKRQDKPNNNNNNCSKLKEKKLRYCILCEIGFYFNVCFTIYYKSYVLFVEKFRIWRKLEHKFLFLHVYCNGYIKFFEEPLLQKNWNCQEMSGIVRIFESANCV